MITAADQATPQTLTPQQQEIDMVIEGAAPTGKAPAFLPPSGQPAKPMKRPTLSLPQVAHNVRAKVQARV
jgi:hypothetical protein